jgi:hypothetical protein
MPFIQFDDCPVSIDEGFWEVLLPHDTGVSLSTRAHRDDYKNVTMADLMAETNYLNPTSRSRPRSTRSRLSIRTPS